MLTGAGRSRATARTISGDLRGVVGTAQPVSGDAEGHEVRVKPPLRYITPFGMPVVPPV